MWAGHSFEYWCENDYEEPEETDNERLLEAARRGDYETQREQMLTFTMRDGTLMGEHRYWRLPDMVMSVL